MRIVPLQQDNIVDLKVFFAKMRGDFLPMKKKAKPVPIEKYLLNTEHKMLVAIQGDFIVGFIAYNTKQRKIVNMGVLPELRGKGLGTELLKRVLMNMRDAKSVTARVWESNAAAIAMLQANGFKRYKVVKDDRINGEASFWYRKKN